MTTLVMPDLELNALIPEFELPTVKGQTIRVWDYKQKENLVLMFMHSLGCEDCMDRIAGFATLYPEFRERNTEILVVVHEKPEGELLDRARTLPFPVLLDENGEAARKFTEIDPHGRPMPALFVVDRFNALYEGYIAEKESDLPSDDQILASLSLLEIQCPECGV